MQEERQSWWELIGPSPNTAIVSHTYLISNQIASVTSSDRKFSFSNRKHIFLDAICDNQLAPIAPIKLVLN